MTDLHLTALFILSVGIPLAVMFWIISGRTH